MGKIIMSHEYGINLLIYDIIRKNKVNTEKVMIIFFFTDIVIEIRFPYDFRALRSSLTLRRKKKKKERNPVKTE